MRHRILAFLIFLIVTSAARAHVGSPNVYFDGTAGPYHILVSVTPPAMVPGVAEVQARVVSGDVTGITIEPVYINGKDQGLPPTPDLMQASAADPQWFEGRVWLMESGSCRGLWITGRRQSRRARCRLCAPDPSHATSSRCPSVRLDALPVSWRCLDIRCSRSRGCFDS